MARAAVALAPAGLAHAGRQVSGGPGVRPPTATGQVAIAVVAVALAAVDMADAQKQVGGGPGRRGTPALPPLAAADGRTEAAPAPDWIGLGRWSQLPAMLRTALHGSMLPGEVVQDQLVAEARQGVAADVVDRTVVEDNAGSSASPNPLVQRTSEALYGSSLNRDKSY